MSKRKGSTLDIAQVIAGIILILMTLFVIIPALQNVFGFIVGGLAIVFEVILAVLLLVLVAVVILSVLQRRFSGLGSSA